MVPLFYALCESDYAEMSLKLELKLQRNLRFYVMVFIFFSRHQTSIFIFKAEVDEEIGFYLALHFRVGGNQIVAEICNGWLIERVVEQCYGTSQLLSDFRSDGHAATPFVQFFLFGGVIYSVHDGGQT